MPLTLLLLQHCKRNQQEYLAQESRYIDPVGNADLVQKTVRVDQVFDRAGQAAGRARGDVAAEAAFDICGA